MNLAPIVLFVYNRLSHTRQTIEYLQKNIYAAESELIIYADGPRSNEDVQDVNQVRNYIKSLEGFKDIAIVEREKNQGLAQSIINGVAEVVNRYGKIIVLEDDIVTSPYFLKFMNDALDYYEQEKKVWHISGWNYPIKSNNLEDTFLWRGMNCWGWATWADRWKFFEKDIDKTIQAFTDEDIYRFNIDGKENFWRQVLQNKTGKKNTWAIFWYATIFQNKGLCLNPARTYVRNTGFDGTGTHLRISFSPRKAISNKDKVHFTDYIAEHKIPLRRIKRYYARENAFIVKAIKFALEKLQQL